MAQSFVPEDTNVVCTMMTVPSPQQIKITQASNVLFKSKEKPLLTVGDNKISCSFACKSPASFWGGLQALAAGIAIGAAVVLTGGAALVVVGVACAVSVAAGCTALYKMAHDCDATLEKKWIKPHNRVTFNGEKALLNSSILQCPKGGGTLTIIMNPAIAKQAAEYISSNNNKEVLAQMGSQFVMGFITSATAGTSTIVVGVSGAITMGLYPLAECLGENYGKTAGNVPTNVTGAVVTDITEANVKANAKQLKLLAESAEMYWKEGILKDNPLAKGFAKFGAVKNLKDMKGVLPQNLTHNIGALKNAKDAAKVATEGLVEGNISRFKWGSLFTAENFKSIKIDKLSLGSLLVNIGIGMISDNYEGNLATDTEDMRKKLDRKDNAEIQKKIEEGEIPNGVSIIAKEA